MTREVERDDTDFLFILLAILILAANYFPPSSEFRL